MTESLSIRLTFAARRQRPTVAWRLPSGDPRNWLTAISTWGVPHASIRIAPLPASRRDRTAAGALVCCSAPSSGSLVAAQVDPELAKPPCPDAIAYGVAGRRLYLPVDGQLWPAMDENELQRLLSDRCYVWEPPIGLIALEVEPWLPLAKFIGRPSWTTGDWASAQAGLVLAPRIIWLGAELPPDADQMLQDSQDNIGTRTDAEAMPTSPDESQPGAISAAKTHGKKLVAGAAQAVSSMLPGSWAERLGHWAERQQASADRTIEADRNREMERLMNLMETDPDEGLKFAPPLSTDAAHRGQADPTNQLGQRDTNFSFGRLSSGGPGEAWSVSGNYYHKLRAEYRKAANRELQLHRYRRAAYIFAELLGDHQAAAGALFAGKFYREAAALYQQKLNSPLRAAECLELGGLITEAIERYIELEKYEKAGDLYQQLGQVEAAHEQYRREVARRRDADTVRDHLAVAKILSDKLDDPAEAMVELEMGWPQSTNAVACMICWFDLARQHCGPLDIRRQILRAATGGVNTSFSGAEILLYVTKTCSTESAQLAKEQLQTLVARNLLDTAPTRRRQLLEFIQQLAPEDRLLTRDCRNYLERRAGREGPPTVLIPHAKTGRNTPIHRTQLPNHVRWQRMCLLDDVVYAVGTASGRITLVAAPWGGNAGAVEQPWRRVSVADNSPLLIASHTHHDSIILVHPLSLPHPLPLKPIRGIKRRASLQAGGLGGVPPQTLAVCRSTHGVVWSVSLTDDQVVLSCYKDEQLLSSKVLIEELGLEAPEYLPQIAVTDNEAYVSWGAQLLVAGPEDRQDVFHDLPQDVRRLACSAPYSRPRVALGYEMGGAMIWNQKSDFKLLPFGDGLIEPEVCINRGGYLIAAGRKRIEVYSTGDTSLGLTGENEDAALDPVHVIGGPGSHQFAVLNANGELQFFECVP